MGVVLARKADFEIVLIACFCLRKSLLITVWVAQPNIEEQYDKCEWTRAWYNDSSESKGKKFFARFIMYNDLETFGHRLLM
jgi:hypothetical protein